MTHQTGPAGKKVNKVLITEDVYYPGKSEPKEFYMSILLDRATSKPVIMASTEGGMNIEEVAAATPEKIIKEWINPAIGLQGFQARKVAFALGLEGNAFKEMVKFIHSLYSAYMGLDASMFEINPVLKTSDDRVIAVDGKVNLDDNALYRHKEELEGNRGQYVANIAKTKQSIGEAQLQLTTLRHEFETEFDSPRLPPCLANAERTSPAVRFLLSVRHSTMTPMPPGPKPS